MLKSPSQKRAGGVAQGLGSEFKPQYQKKKKGSLLTTVLEYNYAVFWFFFFFFYLYSFSGLLFSLFWFNFIFIYLAVPEFELRAYILSHSTSPFL
jgi:hypothetical protein